MDEPNNINQLNLLLIYSILFLLVSVALYVSVRGFR